MWHLFMQGLNLIVNCAIQKSDLVKHVASFHKRIKYECKHCDFRATQKYNLVQHVSSIHKGVRYDCEQCEYSALFKSSLVRHVI